MQGVYKAGSILVVRACCPGAAQAQVVGVRTGSYCLDAARPPGEGWSSYVLVHIPPIAGACVYRSSGAFSRIYFLLLIAQVLLAGVGSCSSLPRSQGGSYLSSVRGCGRFEIGRAHV